MKRRRFPGGGRLVLYVVLVLTLGQTMVHGAQEATLRISTANPTRLNKELHAASTVDIFFSSQGKTVDICGDPYFSTVKALNLTSLHYPGGVHANLYHVIVGDTQIVGGKGYGYNMNRAQVEKHGHTFSDVYRGSTTLSSPVDFFNEYCALVNKLGIHGDILADVPYGTPEELLWALERSRAKRVCYSTELQNKQYESLYPFPKGGAIYAAQVTRLIEAVRKRHPEVKHVIDAGRNPIQYRRRLPARGKNVPLADHLQSDA